MTVKNTHKINKQQLFAELILASVTIFWGATFPIVKDAITEMPVMAFLWDSVGLLIYLSNLWPRADLIG